jgi:hypothetical protein
MTDDKKYGPWVVPVTAGSQPLYQCNDTQGLSVAVLPTTDSDWVLKIRADDRDPDELIAVLLIYQFRPRNSVQFPSTISALCGTAPGLHWYAMRRYAGSAAALRDYCRGNWQALAVAVLAFLEDLHTTIGRVHCDIKPSNILVDPLRREFVVADYESLHVPDGRLTRDYCQDSCWYYLAWGAEPDRPVRSWRMDLTALGYLLADLTWPEDTNRTFYADCLAGRQGEFDPADEAAVMEEIVARRDSEMARACCPTLRAYFETLEISGPAWDVTRPPTRSLYRQLAVLFM